MSRVFFDSNVLLYAFERDDRRSLRATSLVHAGGAISVQCLNEFASVATRKLAMSHDRVDAALAVIIELCDPILPVTLDMHRSGLAIARRYRLAIYDSLIVAAALTAGCTTLYSEDMQDGLVVDARLRIANPFVASA